MRAAILRSAVVRLEVAPAENATANESSNGSSASHPRVDLFGARLGLSVLQLASDTKAVMVDVRIAIIVAGLGPLSQPPIEHLLVASRAYRDGLTTRMPATKPCGRVHRG